MDQTQSVQTLKHASFLLHKTQMCTHTQFQQVSTVIPIMPQDAPKLLHCLCQTFGSPMENTETVATHPGKISHAIPNVPQT